MKTWKRALALVLALVMALSLVALPSFAAGEEDSAGNGSPRVVYEGASGENNGGLVMSKTVTKGEGDDQFLLTLEAFPPALPERIPRRFPWTSSWFWTLPALCHATLTEIAGLWKIRTGA